METQNALIFMFIRNMQNPSNLKKAIENCLYVKTCIIYNEKTYISNRVGLKESIPNNSACLKTPEREY